ncbi:MAG: hypothetical protein AB1758_16240 [Candidatus Eremiobacterota bacterium]
MLATENRVIQERTVNDAPGTTYQEVSEVRLPSPEEKRLAQLERLTQFGQLALSFVCMLIAFRFVFLLMGVNRENAFAQTVLTLSYPLVAPFQTLFGQNPQVGAAVMEFPDLVAIAVYLLAGWGLTWLARLLVAPGDPTGRAYKA